MKRDLAPLWVTKDEMLQVVRAILPELPRREFERVWRSSERRRRRAERIDAQRRATFKVVR